MTTTTESLVTSLEISQRFKELGVPQGQSYFVWIKDEKGSFVYPRYNADLENPDKPPAKILCDAFTLSELYRFDDIARNMTQITGLKSYFFEVESDLINRIKRNIVNPQDLKL